MIEVVIFSWVFAFVIIIYPYIRRKQFKQKQWEKKKQNQKIR